MRTWVIVLVLALVAACHEQAKTAGPAAPASTADADALWALAPDGATLGVVVTPRAIAMASHALVDVRTAMHAAPELADAASQLDAALTEAFGSPTGSLADLGVAPSHGGALFVVPHGKLLIVPVVDRDKFLAKIHGTKGKDEDTTPGATCKTVHGFYACAKPAELLGRVGKGELGKQLAKLGARGEIELVGTDLPVLGGSSTILGAVQLARGAATIHAAVLGVPPALTSRFAAPKTVHVDPHAAGFAIVDVASALKDPPPLPIVDHVTLADLVHAIGGPLTLTLPSGALAFDLRMPLTSTAPFQTLIAHCADVPELAQIGAAVANGTCRFVIPLLGTSVAATVDGMELHVTGRPPAGAASTGVAMTDVGKQLAGQPWTFAFWGRGTIFGMPALPIPSLATAATDTRLGFRMFTVIDELGVGARIDSSGIRFELTARTVWANPDDVVAKLAAISTDDVIHGGAGSAAKAIADGAANAPFAADFRAGVGGLAAPIAAVGALSAVAIPAYAAYMEKAKAAEVPGGAAPANLTPRPPNAD